MPGSDKRMKEVTVAPRQGREIPGAGRDKRIGSLCLEWGTIGILSEKGQAEVGNTRNSF